MIVYSDMYISLLNWEQEGLCNEKGKDYKVSDCKYEYLPKIIMGVHECEFYEMFVSLMTLK